MRHRSLFGGHLRKPLLLGVGAVLALATAGSALAGSDTSVADDVGFDAEVAAVVDREADFHWVTSVPYHTLDPHRVTVDFEAVWMQPSYDRLMLLGRDADGSVILRPELATAVESSPDGLTVEYTLREGVVFHDGTPFDADAVVANIERAQGPDSLVSSKLANVESVEAVDDTHVVFHLIEPDAAFAARMAVGTISMMISPAAFDLDLERQSAGTGPFTLTSANLDTGTEYTRFDGYWNPEAVMIKNLKMSIITDGNARLNGLRSGQYDVGYFEAPNNLVIRDLAANEGYQIALAHEAVHWSLVLNNTKPPLDDVNVRRAIWMALDRQGFSEQLRGGVEPPAYQPFAPGMVGFVPELDVDVYDPDAARELIAASGIGDTPIQLSFPPQNEQMSMVIQDQLTAVGLNVELIPVSGQEATPTLFAGTYHGAATIVNGGYDPAVTMSLGYVDTPWNIAGPSDELRALDVEARSQQFGTPERDEAYQAVTRELVENPVHIPILNVTITVGGRPEVVGIQNMLPLTFYDLDFRNVGIRAE